MTDLSVECAFDISGFDVTKISAISLVIDIKIHIILVLASSLCLDLGTQESEKVKLFFIGAI